MADTARETVWLCLTWVNFTVFFKELGFFTKKERIKRQKIAK